MCLESFEWHQALTGKETGILQVDLEIRVFHLHGADWFPGGRKQAFKDRFHLFLSRRMGSW